jgi:hypothetical protein
MSPWGRPSRRQLIVGALGGVALAAGCTSEPLPPPPPDPLQPLLDAALADAALAEAVAGSHAGLAVVARALAGDRKAHAESLRAEIRRATPSPTPSITSTPSPSGTLASAPGVAASGTAGATVSSGPPVPTDPAAASAALIAATRASARRAADLVTAVPRYRAGLAASVSACCASHLAVLT